MGIGARGGVWRTIINPHAHVTANGVSVCRHAACTPSRRLHAAFTPPPTPAPQVRVILVYCRSSCLPVWTSCRGPADPGLALDVVRVRVFWGGRGVCLCVVMVVGVGIATHANCTYQRRKCRRPGVTAGGGSLPIPKEPKPRRGLCARAQRIRSISIRKRGGGCKDVWKSGTGEGGEAGCLARRVPHTWCVRCRGCGGKGVAWEGREDVALRAVPCAFRPCPQSAR